MIFGIDISAKTFDVVSTDGLQTSPAQTFNNTPEGHQELIKIASSLKPALIAMEATGIYHFELALALTDAGLTVAVINPLSIKRFAQLKLKTVKTDATDAALIAEYAHLIKPAPWKAPNREHISLKDIARRLNRLTRDLTREKNRLHALSAKATGHILIEDIKEAIEHFEQRIARLTAAAFALMINDPALKHAYDNLSAAKGIGKASAIAILGEFVVMDKTMKANQVSRYAGLDVCITRSGTSVRGASRISKAGNIYLRSALFMPAMSAAQFDPHTKGFKQRLVNHGKTKLQANVAVMRKMLTGLWKAYLNEEPFEAQKLFMVNA